MSTLTSESLAAAGLQVIEKDVELTPAALAQDDYENWLETESGIECVDDVIVEKPMAKYSGSVASMITARLVTAGGRDDGWVVFDSSVGFKVYPEQPTKFRKPDLSAVRRSRLASDPDAGFFHIPADLAVEVISPNDKAADLMLKAREYLAHGFKLVWVVDPESRTVLVFRAGEAQSVILGPDDTIDGGDVLPGFACKVSDFFDN